MILTMNNFEFENNHYLQLHGTAVGTKMAPAYANLFMGDLEQKISAQSPLKPWWRYIDDIFMIWLHGEEKLNGFINLLNSSHETIKFTHEVSPSKINFLDVTVLLHNNSIATDLHVKSTDTHQYLLCTSCHPYYIEKSIPYSLAPRILPICSTDDNFKQGTNELLEFLCQQGHKRDYVKTKSTKLSMSYVKTLSTTNTRNPTTVQYLSLPTTQVYQILIISLKIYYPILTASDHCKNAFKDAPLLAYRHPRNLRDTLVHSKIKIPKPSPSSPPKITCCNDGRCKTCKFIAHNTTSYTFHNTGQTRTIHQNLSCSSDNLIYMINCK